MNGTGAQHCLLCGSGQTTQELTIPELPLFLHAVEPEVAADVPRLPFTLGSCASCGHLQQLNAPSDDVVAPIYTKLFGSYQSTARTGIGGLRAQRFLDFVSAAVPGRGRALEVGCFDGYFLSLLARRGMEVVGCDPSPGADIAARELGVEVRREFFRRGMVPDGSFDLFVARQVFEHVQDAQAFLELASSALRPDGFLALELPDADLWLGQGVLGSLFHEHVSYFTEPVLRTAVRRAGFHVVELRHEHTDLFLLARRHASTAVEKLFTDPGTVRHARELAAIYRSRLAGQRKAVRRLAAATRAQGGRLYLYGAGVHSSSLVAACGLTDADVDGVVDDGPQSQGKVLPNLPRTIAAPDLLDAATARDVVIVSGFSFQEEMLARLARRASAAQVVTLYPEVGRVEVGAVSASSSSAPR